MARWGSGDPRWIVEERPDATNVNNWHWTEKNADNWSKQRLKELLIGSVIEGNVGKCVITELECEGEAVVNNRKGKLIFLYEWDITATWKGNVSGNATTIEGKVNIPNLSEENEISEVEINFSITGAYSKEATVLHEFLVKKGKDVIRDKLTIYVKNLKEEFPKGLILPKKDSNSTPTERNDPVKQTKTTNERTIVNNKVADSGGTPVSTSQTTNPKLSTRTLTMSQVFQCTASDLFRALTDPQLARSYASDGFTLQAEENGKFVFFGGNVYGTFIELIPDNKIIQTWRLKDWPADHYSLVTITIEQLHDNTQLNLTQTDVPANEYEAVQMNWSRYYWEPMKRALGFGSFII